MLAEIQDPAQKDIVGRAISDGIIGKASIQTPAELATYVDLSQILGSGESACLALAQSRDWLIACDERRIFLREARSRIGEHRIINTPGLYLLWIRCGLMTVAQADAAKAGAGEQPLQDGV